MTSGDLVIQLEDTDTTKTEPALTPATILASLYGISFFILKKFVPSISDDVINSWYAAFTPILVLILGVIIRSRVWSPRSVQKVVDQSVTNALRQVNSTLPKRQDNKSTELPRRPAKSYEELLKEYPPDTTK